MTRGKLAVLAIGLVLGVLLLAGCGWLPEEQALEATPLPPAAAVVPSPSPVITPSSDPAPTAEKLSAGDARMWEKDGAWIVYVPAGQFVMGIDSDQMRWAHALCKQYSKELGVAVCPPSKFQDERPHHTVGLDGFWIDRTEVTNGQYEQCVHEGGCLPPVESGSFTRDSYYNDDRYDHYPVIWIRWDQAAAYCAWAGRRLPSEAEWEYAARGPQGFMFPWGDSFDGSLLNYCDVHCAGVNDETVDDGYADTAPVGSYPGGASWCGALDMAGNVREWVADWFGYYSLEEQLNPTGPSSGDSRIPRGGSWYDVPDNVRSTNRGGLSSDYTRHKVGFRCASSASPFTTEASTAAILTPSIDPK